MINRWRVWQRIESLGNPDISGIVTRICGKHVRIIWYQRETHQVWAEWYNTGELVEIVEI